MAVPKKRTSKAKKKFGFKSTVNLDQGLMNTIDWYLKNKIK